MSQSDLATSKMASKQRPILQDPGYDSVREICASLGYNSETKTDRHFKILSAKTANYRRSFVESSAALTEFPLSNVAPEVQTCALRFLDHHRHLFPASSEARAFSWPIYPDDKSRILSGIAKLMCAQEYLRQKNARDKATKQSANHDIEIDAPFVVDPTPLTSLTSLVGNNTLIETSRSIFDGPSSSESGSGDEQDIEELQRIIAIHLDYVYPLNHSVDGNASEWLFTSEKCPDDVEPFAFRYLHEHNLYNSKAENIDAIHKFSKDLKLHLHVTCAPSKDHKIFKRCEQLVQRAARKWDAGGYGILTRKNGIIKKTPVFEHAWMHHRRRWIDEINSGVTDGLLEIPPPFQTQPLVPHEVPELASRKRPAEDHDGVESSRAPKEPPSQRMSQGTPTEPPVSATIDSRLSRPLDYSQPSNGRAPEAMMVNPLPGTQNLQHNHDGPSNPSRITTVADTPKDILTSPPIISPNSLLLGTASPALRQPSACTIFEGFGHVGSNYHAPYNVDSPPPLKTETLSPVPHRVEPLYDGLPATAQNSGSVSSQPQSVASNPDTNVSPLVSAHPYIPPTPLIPLPDFQHLIFLFCVNFYTRYYRI
ncbi:hypothetical protein BKA64DRAFT_684637 [Cadophora sp. MPI-SDFR-AT-0126]|nr:hypothetical protein BKA64DRAFT_684637 [Leotiomycetes sp. MPI-SDFR-AT-0126]